MNAIDTFKEQAQSLKLPNSKSRKKQALFQLLPTIKLALDSGALKIDLWRVLVELDIFGKNSYSSYMKILNEIMEKEPTKIEEKIEKPKPVLAAKIPVADKPEPTKPKTESEKKTHEPIWPKDETPSFVYNPIPKSDILD